MILSELTSLYPQHRVSLGKIVEYGQRFLWHEMTMATLEMILGAPASDCFVAFHDKCLCGVRTHLNQFHYVRILLLISKRIPDCRGAYSFLTSATSSVHDSEAKMALRCECAQLCLVHQALVSDVTNTANDVEREVATYLEKNSNEDVHALLRMQYYRLQMAMAYSADDYQAYYTHSFKYLSYCDASTTLDVQDPLDLALRIAIAALKSPKIHHFGEFVSNVVVTAHLSKEYPILMEVLHAFNNGDVDTWEKKREALFAVLPALRDSESALRQKMQTMAMLHLMFYTQIAERVIPFSAIADRCRMQEDEVEYLLLGALAKQLIKGEIDGIKETIKVTSVMPRVLQNSELAIFAGQIEQWKKTVSEVEGSMHRQVEQLTKMFVI